MVAAPLRLCFLQHLLDFSFGAAVGHAGRAAFASPIFAPECPAAGLEQQPGVHALAAQLEVHGHLFAQRTDGLPFLDGRVPADGEDRKSVV